MAAFPASGAFASEESDALVKALDFRRTGDWQRARAAATGVGADIIAWHWLRAGEGSFEDYRNFLDRNADWPGLPLVAERGEDAIPNDADPDAVIAYFTDFPPQTGAGAVKLTQAHARKGETDKAQAAAIESWRNLVLSPSAETWFLSNYADTLAEHHVERTRMLLWNDYFTAAGRLATYLPDGWPELITAVTKLARDEGGVDAAIEAIPAALTDEPVLSHERFEWRARKGRQDDAIALLVERSDSRADLGEPEEWQDRRRRYARQLMRDGEGRAAYDLAAKHHLDPEESGFADLEWLAGYIALAYLKDPELALNHFNRFRMSVGTPISLGRAGYWEGRALEEMGAAEDAQTAYEFGAKFQTAFYGLLAAEKAGVPMDPALTGEARFDDYKNAEFMDSRVLDAALLLVDANELPLAARFMRHLGESLTPQQLGQLGDLALDIDPYLAVLVAKFAADKGIVLNRAYYPLHELADANLPVDAELALSIARRESEFYTNAQSYVGARGLMQLMPGTASDMARKIGVENFSQNDLFDPVMNATLGSAYLADLIERFGKNGPLIAVGYNAGPGRALQWIDRYGDPRMPDVDAVDWIEHIPFRETRNYVMRVMESVPVYRARLAGNVSGPVTLSEELKAR